MSVEKTSVYIARCDYCAEELKDAVTNGRRLFPDRTSAMLEARAAGWHVGDGSCVLCAPAERGHAEFLRKWIGE